mmetsp:Transcript_13775/g.28806  ORF Transcript_13775/g.28806 Transcript_13775/m.28806 type:complete len:353 (-) Transcript_13775:35-1093(-)
MVSSGVPLPNSMMRLNWCNEVQRALKAMLMAPPKLPWKAHGGVVRSTVSSSSTPWKMRPSNSREAASPCCDLSESLSESPPVPCDRRRAFSAAPPFAMAPPKRSSPKSCPLASSASAAMDSSTVDFALWMAACKNASASSTASVSFTRALARSSPSKRPIRNWMILSMPLYWLKISCCLVRSSCSMSSRNSRLLRILSSSHISRSSWAMTCTERSFCRSPMSMSLRPSRTSAMRLMTRKATFPRTFKRLIPERHCSSVSTLRPVQVRSMKTSGAFSELSLSSNLSVAMILWFAVLLLRWGVLRSGARLAACKKLTQACESRVFCACSSASLKVLRFAFLCKIVNTAFTEDSA